MRTILAVLTIALLLPAVSFAREWTSGTHKIEADFVKMEGGKVLLQTPKGEQFAIPFEKLSEADQLAAKKLAGVKAIRTWTAANGKTLEAEFLRVEDGHVLLRNSAGNEIRISLNKLSEADQALVKKLAGAGTVQKSQATSEAPVNEKELQTVRAEGVGATGDEALKDAFRNAVRQVVGAVVDAETMTKNDEVIDDKVLTYSDGFVKHYDRLSEKTQGSLIRIKIEAKVERRSVVAKLQAANITTSKVDGKSMFAEVVSDEEAKKNATQLLAKALTPLPTLLTAELDGKPVPDREKNELVFKVILKPDRKAFDAFRTQLQEVLDKIAVSRRQVMLQGEPHQVKPHAPGFRAPMDNGERESKKWELLLQMADFGSNVRTKWMGYTLDANRKDCLAVLSGATFVTLCMLDTNSVSVAEDEIRIVTSHKNGYEAWYAGPLMRAANVWSRPGFGKPTPPSFMSHLIIAPYSMCTDCGSGSDGKNTFYYYPYVCFTHRTKITLDELKRIAEIKCKVEYRTEGLKNEDHVDPY